MKNIHIIPTDRPSRLYKTGDFLLLDSKAMPNNTLETKNQHIYITSDEEIKEGDWCLDLMNNTIYVATKVVVHNLKSLEYEEYLKKIILTTDQDLIKDGVQAIDDEFLQWFVKNPNCEEVKVVEKQHFEADKSKRKNPLNGVYYSYKIIIPKEELTISDEAKQRAKNYMSLKGALEPKQETLEDFISKSNTPEGLDQFSYEKGLEDGAKWQVERMYSEEDMIKFGKFFKNYEFVDDTTEGELYAKDLTGKQQCYTTKELLQLWKKQQPKVIYYNE